MSKGKVILRSTEGKEFELTESAASLSDTVGNMLEAGCAGDPIPFSNIATRILAKVVEYCKKHDAQDKDDDDEFDIYAERRDSQLADWDASFVREVTDDQDLLFDIILAANFLSIKGLFDLTCKAVADMMEGKSVDEIRKTFNIVNDYTPEEEAEVRQEISWAFNL